MTLRDLRLEEFRIGEWKIIQSSDTHLQTECRQWTVIARHNSNWSAPYKGELHHSEKGTQIEVGFSYPRELQGSLITMMQVADEGSV